MIEEFDWTEHALRRAWEREFDRFEIEMTIRFGHDGRARNVGRADWLVRGERLDGTRFEVIYDHPAGENADRVRVVSVWQMEEGGLS